MWDVHYAVSLGSDSAPRQCRVVATVVLFRLCKAKYHDKRPNTYNIFCEQTDGRPTRLTDRKYAPTLNQYWEDTTRYTRSGPRISSHSCLWTWVRQLKVDVASWTKCWRLNVFLTLDLCSFKRLTVEVGCYCCCPWLTYKVRNETCASFKKQSSLSQVHWTRDRNVQLWREAGRLADCFSKRSMGSHTDQATLLLSVDYLQLSLSPLRFSAEVDRHGWPHDDDTAAAYEWRDASKVRIETCAEIDRVCSCPGTRKSRTRFHKFVKTSATFAPGLLAE